MIGSLAWKIFTARIGTLMKVPVRTLYPQQSSNHVAGMPRNKITFGEKVATGMLLGGCILATPAWVLTHLDDYRGGPAEGGEEAEE